MGFGAYGKMMSGAGPRQYGSLGSVGYGANPAAEATTSLALQQQGVDKESADAYAKEKFKSTSSPTGVLQKGQILGVFEAMMAKKKQDSGMTSNTAPAGTSGGGMGLLLPLGLAAVAIGGAYFFMKKR